MGLLGDIYTWADANLAGGLLPGGHEVTEPGATIAGVVPTPFVGIQPAAQNGAVVGPGAAGGFFGTAGAAAAGIPVSARAPAGVRGRTITAVARLMPDGTIVPMKMMPGSPVAMSSDISAVKRAKRAQETLNKLFPKPRARRSGNRASGKC